MTTVKTLFHFCYFGDGSDFFFEKEGDYSHLDGVYITCDCNPDLIQELQNLVFEPNDPYGYYPIVDKLYIPTKDWTFYVKCGFIP